MKVEEGRSKERLTPRINKRNSALSGIISRNSVEVGKGRSGGGKHREWAQFGTFQNYSKNYSENKWTQLGNLQNNFPEFYGSEEREKWRENDWMILWIVARYSGLFKLISPNSKKVREGKKGGGVTPRINERNSGTYLNCFSGSVRQKNDCKGRYIVWAWNSRLTVIKSTSCYCYNSKSNHPIDFILIDDWFIYIFPVASLKFNVAFLKSSDISSWF